MDARNGWRIGAGLLAALSFVLPFGACAEDAGEGKEEAKPAPAAGEKADGAKRRPAGDPVAGGAGNTGQGPGRRNFGGPGGPGGFGGFGGRWAGAGRGGMEQMINRALGVEPPPQFEDLIYGAERRLVLSVPVGGVDNLEENRSGWRAEEVFTLTDEQTKSLEKLRDDYKTELEALSKKLEEVNAAIAVQVKDLRQKYELRANDVLTGESKTEKEKLDALAKEHAEKRVEKVKESKTQVDETMAGFNKALADARAKNDWNAMRDWYQKGGDLAKTLTDRGLEAIKETAAKMRAAVTGDAKTKLDELFKKAEDRNNPGDRGNRGGNRGAGQPGQTEDAKSMKPPAPPNENF